MRFPKPQRDQAESPKEQAEVTHEEARMVLPGIQTLFGFQLIAVFNARFTEFESADRIVHLLALLLVALAIALIMTPAAYHRICEEKRTSSYFAKLASKLVAAAMVPLLIALSLDIYVVTRIATQSREAWPSAALGCAAFFVFVGFWIVFPYWHRFHADLRTRRARDG
jgi:uncharacterized protein DUF6328